MLLRYPSGTNLCQQCTFLLHPKSCCLMHCENMCTRIKLPRVLVVNEQAELVFHQRVCWLSGEKSFERLWEQRFGEPADIFRMREERLLKTRPE